MYRQTVTWMAFLTHSADMSALSSPEQSLDQV